MRKLIISEFITLDGVIQAPGGKEEDTDGGFTHGGWVVAHWDDGIGESIMEAAKGADALLLGRRTYVGHATAFEPNPDEDPFKSLPTKYVVSKTLTKSLWRGTSIISDEPIAAIRKIKAMEGGNILLDGSSQLAHALFAHDLVDELHLITFPIVLGGGKRLFPNDVNSKFKLLNVSKPLPNGVFTLHYARA